MGALFGFMRQFRPVEETPAERHRRQLELMRLAEKRGRQRLAEEQAMRERELASQQAIAAQRAAIEAAEAERERRWREEQARREAELALRLAQLREEGLGARAQTFVEAQQKRAAQQEELARRRLELQERGLAQRAEQAAQQAALREQEMARRERLGEERLGLEKERIGVERERIAQQGELAKTRSALGMLQNKMRMALNVLRQADIARGRELRDAGYVLRATLSSPYIDAQTAKDIFSQMTSIASELAEKPQTSNVIEAQKMLDAFQREMTDVLERAAVPQRQPIYLW